MWTTPRLDLGQTDGQGEAAAGCKVLPGWTVGVSHINSSSYPFPSVGLGLISMGQQEPHALPLVKKKVTPSHEEKYHSMALMTVSWASRAT